MRRQDIQLLVAARHGDMDARIEVGRRYLHGMDGFPKHLATAIEYLSHPSLVSHPLANSVLADGLSLEEALQWDKLDAFNAAAADGNATATYKLTAFELLSPRTARRAIQRLVSMDEASHWHELASLAEDNGEQARAASQALRRLSESGVSVGLALFSRTLQRALQAQDLDRCSWIVDVATPWLRAGINQVAEDLVRFVDMTETAQLTLGRVERSLIEAALECRAALGDPRALYLHGRALAGIKCTAIEPRSLVRGSNVRKGTALLLRAADAGNSEAWMHLYRLSSDHRRTVANPQMARFFLEKAAQTGHSTAQRMLGALLLRESEELHGSERALNWLHLADQQGDSLARDLMSSLVLPVAGDDAQAAHVVSAIGRTDPLLAARLSVARRFGLTKLEALGVDLVTGVRPWGLVIGHNPHIRQRRLAAGRAVPAVSSEATQAIRRATALYSSQESTFIESSPHPQRARSIKTLLQRFGADESTFFADANSTTLDSLRVGAKWAYRARDVLRAALSDSK